MEEEALKEKENGEEEVDYVSEYSLNRCIHTFGTRHTTEGNGYEKKQ